MTNKKIQLMDIKPEVLQSIARVALDGIRKFYEDEKNVRAYEEWKYQCENALNDNAS